MELPRPISLDNAYVSLLPVALDHAAGYLEIGRDPEIWKYLAPDPFKSRSDAEKWIAGMLARSSSSGAVTFSIYDKLSGRLAGSSSYLDVRANHGGLEIGYTWYGKNFQRTHVNTASKLALLEHAFEALNANRVQFQTDARNQASQKAIARIGASKEGILRQHKIYPDGYIRDSVWFSVVRNEWPDVKERLLGFLASNNPKASKTQ